jgi:hypothetical protein
MKKWLKNRLAAIGIAFSNVEKNIINQGAKSLDEIVNQDRRYMQGILVDSLLHGEVTQEVKNLRWRTYKVLKASDGMFLEYEYTDENGNVIYKTKKFDNKSALRNVKLDSFDDYELEMVFNNDEITISVDEAISDNIKEYEKPVNNTDENGQSVTSHGEITNIEYFATNKTQAPINITRAHAPRFFIENFTKRINVRKINDTERLLEFYVSKYSDTYNKNSKIFIKEIEKVIKSGPRNFNFLEFDEVEFITNKTIGAPDFLHYSYKILNFNKIIEFDGNYVIKFNSEILIDGEDILNEYIEKELDKKYNNKEAKKQ